MVYDLIVLGILIIAAVRGASRGMAWQLAAIASLVMCFLFATPLSVPVAQMIKVEPPLNRWIAMLAIYILFSLICFGAARGIRGWLEKARFVEYDRHLGAMFGLVKGALFCFVLTFFLAWVNSSTAEYVLHTKSGYVTAVAIQKLHKVMPAEIDEYLHRYVPGLPHHDEVDHEHEHDHDEVIVDHREREPAEVPQPRNRYRPSNEFRGSTRNPPVVEERPGPQPIPDRLRPTASKKDDHELTLENLVGQVTDLVGKKVQEAVSNSVDNVLPTSEATPTQRPATRAELTDRIVAIFSSRDEIRQSLREEIEASLADIPEPIAQAVLRDWYGDLMGESPDTDPETDVTTDLSYRIERQHRRR